MQNWISHPVSRHFLRTSFWLVIVSSLSIFILASIVSLSRVQESGNPVWLFSS